LEMDKGVLSVFAWNMLRWHQLDFSAHRLGDGRGLVLISPAPFSLLRHGKWAQYGL
jgi:hypothetical protein